MKNQKKMNSSEQAFHHDNVMAELVGCLPFDYSTEEDEAQMQSLNENILEIEAMIDHFITLNNQEEISYFRKMLQRAKVQKRLLKAKMIEKMNKEISIA